MDIWAQMRADLADLKRRALRRHPVVLDSPSGPRVRVAGEDLVNLCGNDYLGLAADPEVCSAATEAIRRWGVGAGASRLVSGTMQTHMELQQALAEFERAEAAIVTSTGWQANAAALAGLAGEGDLVLLDKLDHASIIDAARASGATFRTYAHANPDRLRQLLDRHRSSHKRCVIVTDGLFSMDGDLAPLGELVEIKRRYDAVLVVDEAHATGVLGEQARGSAELAGMEELVDVTVGTLSKALGAMGGFVAGRRELIETILNKAPSFIYTTALPPAMCAAAGAALRIVQREPARRQTCLANAERLRGALSAAGLDTGVSCSQIVPVIVGPAEQAIEISRRCFDAGYLLPAIRPPTVAPGTARLRISVMATHAWSDLAGLVKLLTA